MHSLNAFFIFSGSVLEPPTTMLRGSCPGLGSSTFTPWSRRHWRCRYAASASLPLPLASEPPPVLSCAPPPEQAVANIASPATNDAAATDALRCLMDFLRAECGGDLTRQRLAPGRLSFL